jgi:isopenicillin-N epimerase
LKVEGTKSEEVGNQAGIYRRAFLRGLVALGVWPSARAGDLTPILNDAAPDGGGWPAADDPEYWARIRRQFLMPPDEAYFNTGTLGACPREVLDAVISGMRETEATVAGYDYRPEHPEYISGYRPQVDLRRKAGELINARAPEVALVQNATMGINFVANGLELKPGDEVLLTDQEHPGGHGAWDLRAKRHGIKVRNLPLPIPTPDPETVIRIFTEAVGPRTRVIALPHITSKYGIVMPVRAICELGRQRGIFTFVDGAQAVGQLCVDVKEIGCDAYATSLHKWLLAPPGNGLLYVREGPAEHVWATLASAQWDNYSPADGLFRLMQYGTGNASLLVGLDAAIDFYKRIGAERIQKRITGLADRLRAGLRNMKGVKLLSPTHPGLAGAMVTYGVGGVTGPQLQDELWNRKKIRVRSQGKEAVRQSVHLYNSPEEIDATLEVVAGLAG